MAKGNIDFDEVKKEILRYGDKHPLTIQEAILSKEIRLNRLAKTLANVKGKWSLPNFLMSNVVQNYSPKWTEFGQAQFGKKVMQNFKQKVNFPFTPAEIRESWIEYLHVEGLEPDKHPFSWFIIEELKKKIIDDLNVLSITGEYDANYNGSETPLFGTSMNGFNKVIESILNDTENPAFTIPIDAGDNIVKKVNTFEKSLPELAGAKVQALVVSMTDFNEYVDLRETPSDKYQNNTDPERARTKFNRELIGLPGMKPGTIAAWVGGNFFRLYDRKNDPAKIDQVQVLDYDVKLFSEWTLGYDFAINQYTFISSIDGSAVRGLGDNKQNALYYSSDFRLPKTTPTPTT